LFAAAGHKDGFVRVFEMGSGDRVATLGAAGAPVHDVEFVRGGRAVVARSRSGDAWVYPCDACRTQPQLLELARERAARRLTPDERRRYLHGGSG
jgi:hypothetical protein